MVHLEFPQASYWPQSLQIHNIFVDHSKQLMGLLLAMFAVSS